MSKLIYSLDGAFLGEFPLEKERTTIGRRPTNDIHIDNLAVSGQHAAVISIGNDAFLEDLESTNGTLVNGKPVKKHVLQHGDVIEIGKYQLKYVNEAVINAATGGAPQQDFDKTMIIRPSAMKPAAGPAGESAGMSTTTIRPAAVPPPPAAEAPATPAAASASAPAGEPSAAVGHIQVLTGPSMGKELVLSKALTTLGKPGVQVAVITKRPQGYFITHVEGQQHPVVNGESVGAQAHQLKDHDVIELAGVKMEFFVVNG